jgi:hypothetical protein
MTSTFSKFFLSCAILAFLGTLGFQLFNHTFVGMTELFTAASANMLLLGLFGLVIAIPTAAVVSLLTLK